jgi:hypothetical protein
MNPTPANRKGIKEFALWRIRLERAKTLEEWRALLQQA